jgi:dTDP-4-dehydrorhamnose 3,5-epimerase/CDP-3, 6-dideoxy-D-glycero-D-glycero-4-hexulose-5-epimerase
MSVPFETLPTGFPGLHLLRPRLFQDQRGLFIKTFRSDQFRDLDIPFEPREEFYSLSAKNVLRGMHFQLPPGAHAKLVYCLSGSVLDVVLDMRHKSSTYGKSYSVLLDNKTRDILFIPVGFAHGFLSLEDNSLMVYKTDAVHAPELDTGIAWNSFGFDWKIASPIMSERDRKFVAWSEFQSPF